MFKKKVLGNYGINFFGGVGDAVWWECTTIPVAQGADTEGSSQVTESSLGNLARISI